MKKVLSLLMAFVFLQVQTWALSGGPFGQGTGTLTGTYSGTIIGQVSFDANGNANAPAANANQLSANGLGIYSIGLPATGLGSGLFAFFAQGITYTGAIIGIGDPGKRTINGILKGQANSIESGVIIFNNGTVVPYTFNVVNGYLGAQFESKVTFQRPDKDAASGIRMQGTAIATSADANNVVIGSSVLIIDGFLQSGVVTGTVDLNQLAATESGQ